MWSCGFCYSWTLTPMSSMQRWSDQAHLHCKLWVFNKKPQEISNHTGHVGSRALVCNLGFQQPSIHCLPHLLVFCFSQSCVVLLWPNGAEIFPNLAELSGIYLKKVVTLHLVSWHSFAVRWQRWNQWVTLADQREISAEERAVETPHCLPRKSSKSNADADVGGPEA